MDFTTEKLIQVIAEVEELTKLHYEESAPYDDIPLIIDWSRLLNAEKAGVLKIYCMRENGKLIGYASFFVSSSIEYLTSLQANMGNIFLHPDYRGTAGIRFIKWCDKQLESLGVQVVYHHCKARNDYGRLLKRLGYVTMNIVYSKRLDLKR